MSQIKRHKVLYNDSAAGTGDWIRLDNRYGEHNERVLQAELTAPDTLVIEVITADELGSMSDSYLDDLTAQDITILTTFTADGNYFMQGPWTWIRARKTGTAANGKVQGFI